MLISTIFNRKKNEKSFKKLKPEIFKMNLGTKTYQNRARISLGIKTRLDIKPRAIKQELFSKNHSIFAKQKISISKKGKIINDAAKQKTGKSQKKKVLADTQ
jgi:hypothetical protein